MWRKMFFFVCRWLQQSGEEPKSKSEKKEKRRGKRRGREEWDGKTPTNCQIPRKSMKTPWIQRIDSQLRHWNRFTLLHVALVLFDSFVHTKISYIKIFRCDGWKWGGKKEKQQRMHNKSKSKIKWTHVRESTSSVCVCVWDRSKCVY